MSEGAGGIDTCHTCHTCQTCDACDMGEVDSGLMSAAEGLSGGGGVDYGMVRACSKY